MQIAEFTEKYDKLSGNTYSVEEQIAVPDGGTYSAYLEHDNVDDDTVQVWTGKAMRGSKISYSLTAPSERPFKRYIEFSTNSGTAYISYECTGDQVEAEDINDLQDEVKKTQQFANQLAEVVTGASGGFTWNRLMGITTADGVVITLQPENVNVNAGANATFTITAVGTGLTYQWQVSKKGAATWTDYATTKSITIKATTDYDRCRVRCIVSSSDGDTAVSDTVVLTVSS